MIMYLDNILIYTKEVKKHKSYVLQVLKALHCYGLFVKLKKCAFSKDFVEYLGFIIFKQGLSINLSCI